MMLRRIRPYRYSASKLHSAAQEQLHQQGSQAPFCPLIGRELSLLCMRNDFLLMAEALQQLKDLLDAITVCNT
jgi:hypothetical protein